MTNQSHSISVCCFLSLFNKRPPTLTPLMCWGPCAGHWSLQLSITHTPFPLSLLQHSSNKGNQCFMFAYVLGKVLASADDAWSNHSSDKQTKQTSLIFFMTHPVKFFCQLYCSQWIIHHFLLMIVSLQQVWFFFPDDGYSLHILRLPRWRAVVCFLRHQCSVQRFYSLLCLLWHRGNGLIGPEDVRSLRFICVPSSVCICFSMAALVSWHCWSLHRWQGINPTLSFYLICTVCTELKGHSFFMTWWSEVKAIRCNDFFLITW